MALDWNKEISFGKKKDAGKTRKSGKGAAYPTKKTMNLLGVSTSTTNYRQTALFGALLAVLVIAFIKFAIFDLYAAVNEKQAEYNNAASELALVESQLGDYEEVQKEYQSYTGAANNTSGIPDALIVTQMIDHVIGKQAETTGITMQENTVTVDIDDVTLKRVGTLASQFRDQDIVESVSVSTANNEDEASDKVSATLTITLIGGVDENAPATTGGNDLSYNPAA